MRPPTRSRSRATSRWTFWTLVAVVLAVGVVADTDIVNFGVPLDAPPAPAVPRITLTPSTPTTLRVSSAEPEVWLALDAGPGKWTARMSWPGSTPTRFTLRLYAHAGTPVLHVHAAPLSPRMRHPVLARVRRWAAGMGWGRGSDLDLDLDLGLDLGGAVVGHQGDGVKGTEGEDADADADTWAFDTRFHVVLEPLVLGVIPATAVPAIGGVLVAVLAAGAGVPFVLWFVRRVLADAEEADGGKGSKDE